MAATIYDQDRDAFAELSYHQPMEMRVASLGDDRANAVGGKSAIGPWPDFLGRKAIIQRMTLDFCIPIFPGDRTWEHRLRNGQLLSLARLLFVNELVQSRISRCQNLSLAQPLGNNPQRIETQYISLRDPALHGIAFDV